jgi:hypothetical protein
MLSKHIIVILLVVLSHICITANAFFFGKKSEKKEILSGQEEELSRNDTSYGVDHSFPIHHYLDGQDTIFSRRYKEMIDACYKKYSKMECQSTERDRINMNLAV